MAVALLLTLPGVDEVRERLSAANAWWIVLAAACALGSMLGFVRALWAAFDRVMPWRRALVLGFAEQGANVLLPAGGTGGPALGAVVMRRAGVPARLAAERHVVLFLATSAVSFAALIIAGVGTALFGHEPLVGTLLPAGVGLAVLALAGAFAHWNAPPPRAGGTIRRTVGRLWRFLHEGVRMTVHVLLHGDRLLVVGAIGYYAFDVASLAAAFEAFGGEAPGPGAFLLAYTIGHAGALLPTPGGIGGTEGGLIGMFALYGTPLDAATVAVLAYRVFQLGLPALLGALSMLRIRKLLADQSRRAEIRARWEARDAGSS